MNNNIKEIHDSMNTENMELIRMLTEKISTKNNQDSIHYIGKESNELDTSGVVGVSLDDTIQYVNHQKKLRKIIENLTEEKSIELGISRRMYYYLKKKLQSKDIINIQSKTNERVSQAFPYY